jgi:hypothetical protein
LAEKLDSKTLIPVVNKRGKGYSASLRNGDYYEWLPSKDGFQDVIELEFKDVQQLHMNSVTFKEGFLYVDHEEARKRLGLEKEEVKANQLSHEDIIKALNGNMGQFNTLLKVTNRQLLREVVEVAKKIKLTNVTKLQKLSEVSGIPMDLMLDQE